MTGTIYDEIGGEAAVQKATEMFYDKVVQDTRIASFFEGLDMNRQRKMMVSFLSMAIGGPSGYEGKDMRKAHAHLVKNKGLSDVHFDAVMEHLGATLTELSVPAGHIQTIAQKVEGLRDEVLNR